MGYVSETIEITVRMHNHNDERDVLDRSAFERLQWMIRKDISEIVQEHPHKLTITTIGLG